MDKFIQIIAEDLVDDIDSSIMDDEMEEAYCFLSETESSYEVLDKCSKED